MSNVVINNEKQLSGQRLNKLGTNVVSLPFNVEKSKIEKLVGMLRKTKMSLFAEPDRLNINSLVFNNVNVEAPRAIMGPNKMTLAKTYVVTMAKKFSSKAEDFYKKFVEKKQEDNPVFGITNELNLQEALKLQQEAFQEATTEIDLTELNKVLNDTKELPNEEQPTEAQVLSNSPLGETVIENPINLNSAEQPEVIPVQETANIQVNSQVQEQVETPSVEQMDKPNVKVRKLRGNVLAVPIVIVWLGIVLVGTIKAVTAIMS